MDVLYWYVPANASLFSSTAKGYIWKMKTLPEYTRWRAGFIPLLGDLVNIMLNYNLIVKLAKKLDLPESIMSRIYVNNAVAAGVGWVSLFRVVDWADDRFVPLVGDVALGMSDRASFEVEEGYWWNSRLESQFA
jgi:hypothetical protein